MEREKHTNLPPEVLDKIRVVYEDPIDIAMDDIDTNMLGEDYRELISDLTEIIIRWHNMPLICDDFENHHDRRKWRKELEDEYGEGSDEVKFVETNKLRRNNIHQVIGAMYPLLKTELFTDEEREKISVELKKLVDLLEASEDILGIIKRLEVVSLEVLERFVYPGEDAESLEGKTRNNTQESIGRLLELERKKR